MSAPVSTELVRYHDVQPGDVIVGRNTERLYEVLTTERVRDMVRIVTLDCTAQQIATYELEATRTCTVDRDARTHCERCTGTGIYIWGGTVNGKPVHQGPCFRCGGKGTQDARDRRRNRNYDRYGIRL